MATVLVVSDLAALRRDLETTLSGPDIDIVDASTGAECFDLLKEHDVDLAILDLQITNMGAMAICLDLHHEESYGALDHIPVLMLLDRRADVFLARRSGAEGFVLKPLDPLRLRRAVRALLNGDTYEDDSRTPVTVPAGAFKTE